MLHSANMTCWVVLLAVTCMWAQLQQPVPWRIWKQPLRNIRSVFQSVKNTSSKHQGTLLTSLLRITRAGRHRPSFPLNKELSPPKKDDSSYRRSWTCLIEDGDMVSRWTMSIFLRNDIHCPKFASFCCDQAWKSEVSPRHFC